MRLRLISLALLLALATACGTGGVRDSAAVAAVELDVIVFLEPDATEAEVDVVGAVLEGHDAVAGIRFVPPEAALERFRTMTTDPALLEAVSAEVLPPSFEVTNTGPGRSEMVAASVRSLPAVYRVEITD